MDGGLHVAAQDLKFQKLNVCSSENVGFDPSFQVTVQPCSNVGQKLVWLLAGPERPWECPVLLIALAPCALCGQPYRCQGLVSHCPKAWR